MTNLESFVLVSILSIGFIWMGVELIQSFRGYSGVWIKGFKSPVFNWFLTILFGCIFGFLTLTAAKDNSLIVNHFISNTVSFAIGFILFRLIIWRKQQYCKIV